MLFYDKNKRKIALKFSTNDFKEGLSFFTEDEDFIQFGSWNYNKDKKLLAHIHNPAKREVAWTQEFIFLISGSLITSLYDDEENLIEEVPLKTNEGMIMFAGGHGYRILEDNTKVIEVKNGPYVGAELDRRRIEK